MKKAYIALGITLGVLVLVLIAFGIQTKNKTERGGGVNETLAGNAAVESTEGDNPNAKKVAAIDLYYSILMEEQYKKDSEFGFDNDVYFLLADIDQDNEKELLVTGPIGMDSLYATLVYDYENEAICFTSIRGELVMVGTGAIGCDGWQTEGQETEITDVYTFAPGAEGSIATHLSMDFGWSLVLYSDLDYGDLDLSTFDHVFAYPTDAESIDQFCKD